MTDALNYEPCGQVQQRREASSRWVCHELPRSRYCEWVGYIGHLPYDVLRLCWLAGVAEGHVACGEFAETVDNVCCFDTFAHDNKCFADRNQLLHHTDLSDIVSQVDRANQ